MRQLEAPKLPAWPPAPPPELLTSPPRFPAPWTRAKVLQVAPPPQAALRRWWWIGEISYAAPTDRLFRTPPPPLGSRRLVPKSVRGPLAGLRSPAPRPRARRGAPVLHHHSIGSTTTTTTTTVGLAAANSTWGLSPLGVPAAEIAVAPLLGSLEGPGPHVSGAPFFLISLFSMPTGLNPSFACQGFLPLSS
jgi:hypothetical protein